MVTAYMDPMLELACVVDKKSMTILEIIDTLSNDLKIPKKINKKRRTVKYSHKLFVS
jgi:hypothetical protein